MAAYDPKKPSTLRYERENDLIRLTLTNVSNHELREIMVGLWGRLNAADRVDHIRELTVYATETDSWVSPVAAGIMKNPGDGGIVDLKALIARGEKIRP